MVICRMMIPIIFMKRAAYIINKEMTVGESFETEKKWKTTIHYKKSSRIFAAYFCVYRVHWYLCGKKGQ